MPKCVSTQGTVSTVSPPCSRSSMGSLSLTNRERVKPRSARRSLPARLGRCRSRKTRPSRALPAVQQTRSASAVCSRRPQGGKVDGGQATAGSVRSFFAHVGVSLDVASCSFPLALLLLHKRHCLDRSLLVCEACVKLH